MVPTSTRRESGRSGAGRQDAALGRPSWAPWRNGGPRSRSVAAAAATTDSSSCCGSQGHGPVPLARTRAIILSMPRPTNERQSLVRELREELRDQLAGYQQELAAGCSALAVR